MGQAGVGPRGTKVFSPGDPGHPQSSGAFVRKETLFTSGCVDLDYRVFGGCLYEGLGGINDAKAEKARLLSSARASILSRVLLSRVYGHDDLQAILSELEEDVPFQRLWSTDNPFRNTESAQANEGGEAGESSNNSCAPPEIIIFTEIDHHFKWMRLQNNGGRVYELYGQLMRRLRALATASSDSGAHLRRRLIFVLNGTLMRRPEASSTSKIGVAATLTDENTVDGARKRQQPARTQIAEEDAVYRLALAALQRGLHSDRPAVFRMCCDELGKAQCIEPRYKTLLDYYCSLHICLTRLPASLVSLWEGVEGGSTNPADSALWVATVESDEYEDSRQAEDRIGIVNQTCGTVQDVFIS
ncbi:hypothetical protein SEPCBS57363_002648 [Sporothrix epigloea]|uniref:Uncharacterized protein n=1 Tax=Sporothrix epigloea TaxID=1892477 RepID=A0ABP0DH45_9PEZI